MGKKLRRIANGTKEFGAYALNSLKGEACGAATCILAFMLSTLGCGNLVFFFVMSVIITILIAKAQRFELRGKILLIAFTILVCMSCGIYCKNNNHKEIEAKENTFSETTPEVETEDEMVEEVEVVEEVEKKDTFERNYLTNTTRKECIDLNAEIKNLESLETGKAKAEGEEKVSVNGTTTDTNDDLIIEEAKKILLKRLLK